MSGWQFKFNDERYWVKAPSAEEAQKHLAKRSPDAAKTQPEPMPQGLLNFIGMKDDGDIASGNVFRSGGGGE